LKARSWIRERVPVVEPQLVECAGPEPRYVAREVAIVFRLKIDGALRPTIAVDGDEGNSLSLRRPDAYLQIAIGRELDSNRQASLSANDGF
jgi:hypothetical protein